MTVLEWSRLIVGFLEVSEQQWMFAVVTEDYVISSFGYTDNTRMNLLLVVVFSLALLTERKQNVIRLFNLV